MIFTGKVISGKQRGRELGFPTANVCVEEYVDPGVWAGWVRICIGEYSPITQEGKKEYRSAIYVQPEGRLLEAHILEFDGDLYGKRIEITLEKKIRDPQIFDSVELLKKQIAKDVVKVWKLV